MNKIKKELTLKQRFNRLDRMIKKGNVIRGKWMEGQERACLLAALSPEAGEKETSEACPASVLPQWFSYLTPSMDDNGTLKAWPAFIKRYASVVRKASSVLDAEGWRRAEYRVKVLGVEEAVKHTTNEEVIKVCERVIELNKRIINGETVSEEERRAAESAAWSAAKSAVKSAMKSATWSAAESAAWSAAESATKSAAESATKSAAESAAESATKSAAWSAAESAAWDRLNDKILDALEVEINSH